MSSSALWFAKATCMQFCPRPSVIDNLEIYFTFAKQFRFGKSTRTLFSVFSADEKYEIILSTTSRQRSVLEEFLVYK